MGCICINNKLYVYQRRTEYNKPPKTYTYPPKHTPLHTLNNNNTPNTPPNKTNNAPPPETLSPPKKQTNHTYRILEQPVLPHVTRIATQHKVLVANKAVAWSHNHTHGPSRKGVTKGKSKAGNPPTNGGKGGIQECHNDSVLGVLGTHATHFHLLH